MKKFALPHGLVLLSTFLDIATATFNLNTSGPDWAYTANDLANTTSQSCKNAYSADIDCDETLLGLVASMRPAFKPDTTDFDNTCTASCKASLDSYVAGVQAACTSPGDKAQESVGGGDNVDMYLDPVEIVGQIFQYTFASDCAKSSNGSYCYFGSIGNADSFSCDDTCSVDFYTAAHDYPASAKEFNYYWLISRGSWWAGEFATGWTRLTKVCGVAGVNSISTSNSTETATTTGTASGILNMETTTASVSSAAVTATATSTGSSSATTSKSSPTTSANAGSNVRAGQLVGPVLLSLMYACFLI